MTITPELQNIINSEVAKRELALESTYKKHFANLKNEMFETLQTFADGYINSGVNKQNIAIECENKHYKPIVESILSVLKDNGVKIVTDENDESEEIKELLMEAVKKIQELKDLVSIHEMIHVSLSGLEPNIISLTLDKFKTDPKYIGMKKDDFLKEVASFVLNLKDPATKAVQFESYNIDTKEIEAVDNLLEGNNGNKTFNPSTKISIPALRKKIMDEAHHITVRSEQNINIEDPAQEVLDIWQHR